MSALPRSVPHFRRMRSADLDIVAAHETAAYEAPWTRGNFKDALEAGYDCWLLLSGSQVIGHAVLFVAANEAHLLNLTVAVEWQGRGYGRAFLQHLLLELKSQPADVMLLEVRPSNAVALRLYADFDFSQIGLRRNYYPCRDGGHEDAWVLSRSLIDVVQP